MASIMGLIILKIWRKTRFYYTVFIQTSWYHKSENLHKKPAFLSFRRDVKCSNVNERVTQDDCQVVH